MATELTKEANETPQFLILKTGNWLQEQEYSKILLENALESLSDLLNLESTDSKIPPLQKEFFQHRQRVADLSDLIGDAYLVLDAGPTGPDYPLHLQCTRLAGAQDEYSSKERRSL